MGKAQSAYEAECAEYNANVPKWRRQFSHMDECALNTMLANMMPEPPADEEEEDDE